jgi:hypothetical protein
MVTKVLQTTSWVLMRSLPWAHHKKWIQIGSMGCVHMHWKKPTIEGWGNSSCVQSVVEKTKEVNQKVWNIGWIVSQEPIPRPEHNGFQISCWKTCWKGSNGADALKWNLEIKPFVT